VKRTVNQDLSNSQAKSHGSDAIRTQVSKIPWVTLLLIASNIAVAFWAVLNPNLANDYGFRASEPTLLTFFTNLFVHANTLHLMANMVFLAAVGAAVEIATGSLRFSIVFFLSGSLGTVLYWLALRSTVDAPVLIGASGGIAGCATFFSLKYTKLRVPFAPKRSTTVPKTSICDFADWQFVTVGRRRGTGHSFIFSSSTYSKKLKAIQKTATQLKLSLYI
jgi:membrane associated rhomboid family serine protease